MKLKKQDQTEGDPMNRENKETIGDYYKIHYLYPVIAGHAPRPRTEGDPMNRENKETIGDYYDRKDAEAKRLRAELATALAEHAAAKRQVEALRDRIRILRADLEMAEYVGD